MNRYSSYDYNSSYNYGASGTTQSNYGTTSTLVGGNQQWTQQSTGYGQSTDQYSYPPSHYGDKHLFFFYFNLI